MRTGRSRVVVLLSLLATVASIYSCTAYRYTPRPITEVDLARDGIASRVVRLTTDSGFLTLNVVQLDFPRLYGVPLEGPGFGEVDPAAVREAWSLEKPTTKYRRITRLDQDFPAMFVTGTTPVPNGAFEFRTASGSVFLGNPHRTADGWIRGRIVAKGDGTVRVDLRDVRGLDIKEVNGPMTALRIVGVTSAVVGVVALVVALTKESCPFVYVDDGEGWHLAGEAYAGAAFRSTQRNDLLPLPVLGTGDSLAVRLRNEARETQYTDQARLVVVDHPAGTRMLSTFDGELAMVGAGSLAVEVRDTRDREVSALLARRDDQLVEMTAPDVAGTPDSLLEDHITARFEVPRGGQPVLEMVAGNTTLLDLTFGRFFAAMGDRLDEYLRKGNDSASGPGIQRWREREGVDLIVEMRRDDAWEKVAVIPTVGPAAVRAIAVPLPLTGALPEQVQVRLRSGLGFWRIDHLALSARVAGSPTVARIAPAVAEGSDSSDQRDAIDAIDGRYNALAEINESVDMTFALPGHPKRGETRSVFLFSSGYYNVHPPIQSQWLPGTLKVIRDERGSMARFGRDLARVYVQAAASP